MSRRPLAPLNAGSIQDQERQHTVDFRATIRENYGVVFFNNGIWVMPPPPPVPNDEDEDIEEEEDEDVEEYSDSDGDADDEFEDEDESNDEDVEYVFDSDPKEPMDEQREQ
ncbi:hypothetical protein CRE_09065 [Caenorhabditis remanei]|uniref:Uncharacterized protein n=1 Tax=Caenorhabditis remanei TaxID=31234 RepID=E3LJ54_CAERE|nr:hypothetical protein CRE_09065 [Caenorhabditis remanei]